MKATLGLIKEMKKWIKFKMASTYNDSYEQFDTLFVKNGLGRKIHFGLNVRQYESIGLTS